jgi:hypothetical protein
MKMGTGNDYHLVTQWGSNHSIISERDARRYHAVNHVSNRYLGKRGEEEHRDM